MVENRPCFILIVDGIVIVEALKLPAMTPMMMKPFMFVMAAVRTTEVSPERGEEMDRMGVV